MDVIPNRIQIRNLHISEIRFLFPVSFTIEYNVDIAEFYLFMRFGADLLKNVVSRAWKLPKSESAHLWNWQTTSGLSDKHSIELTELSYYWVWLTIIEIWPQRTLAENWGLCTFRGGGAGSPSNTPWPGPRPTCMQSFILIHPTIWPQYSNIADRQTNNHSSGKFSYCWLSDG